MFEVRRILVPSLSLFLRQGQRKQKASFLGQKNTILLSSKGRNMIIINTSGSAASAASAGQRWKIPHTQEWPAKTEKISFRYSSFVHHHHLENSFSSEIDDKIIYTHKASRMDSSEKKRERERGFCYFTLKVTIFILVKLPLKVKFKIQK